MLRVHIVPRLGERPLTKVSTDDVDAMTRSLLRTRNPKTVRTTVIFLHTIFEHANDLGWCEDNSVRKATRSRARRDHAGSPDLQFLPLAELEAVLRAIPDHDIHHPPAPIRSGRRGPAPPNPSDVYGPALRRVVLTAALTGLRRSELIGLGWRDIDWNVQRIRVRNAYVLGEHSSEGKSDRSTRRSVPMADPLAGELDTWSQRTFYADDDDLVFAHPLAGNPLDGSKVTKRFQDACVPAGVRKIRFHDLRHTLRHPPRRHRPAPTHHPGVHGPRRPQDHPDLRPLRALSARGADGQPGVRHGT
ncbi:MAG: hypothetical protein QOJ82_201 [Solirubrobacteraceae bacterium]|nr:hypothetical protein [Solirubrobacteraceae bacterium]